MIQNGNTNMVIQIDLMHLKYFTHTLNIILIISFTTKMIIYEIGKIVYTILIDVKCPEKNSIATGII